MCEGTPGDERGLSGAPLGILAAHDVELVANAHTIVTYDCHN